METDRAFNRATAARGIDGWVEFAADDAAFMPEGVDFVRGKDAVRQAYAPMFARKGFSLTWEPIEAVVSASGDLGYTLGRWKSSAINPEGKTVTGQGKYVTIWKKQKDGSWKAVVDIGNTGRAPGLLGFGLWALWAWSRSCPNVSQKRFGSHTNSRVP